MSPKKPGHLFRSGMRRMERETPARGSWSRALFHPRVEMDHV
jgi:hypothetical protein